MWRIVVPNLADSHMCAQFVKKLETCESSRLLTNWEMQFITGLRNSFDERETQLDLGVQPWNPTSNQWNTLSEIAEKAR